MSSDSLDRGAGPRGSGDASTAAISALRLAASRGVEVCFANPGTTELPLVEALDAVPEIRAILGLFEGVCTGAADGYGRMRGAPALTLLHLGPGFANGIANLHNARRARTPIVNLIGDHASWHLELDAPLHSDIRSLASPVSDWLRTSEGPDRLAEDLDAAILAAQGPPGGVSTLIVPADHQWLAGGAAAHASEEPAPVSHAEETRESWEHVDALAERLSKGAKAIFLLGGSGLGAAGQLAAGRIAVATDASLLAETFPARWERGDGLPAIQRLPYFPEQAREALAGFDIVVLAGAREPVAFFGYPGVESRLASDGQLFRLCEPHEDAGYALERLAVALGATAVISPHEHAPPGPRTGALDPASIGAILSHHMPHHAIVVEEAATTGLPFYGVSTGAPRHTVLTLTGGAIGQGLPCATGAAVACPDRKVIAFQADGSGMYTLQALWTQAREQLDVVTLICSNRAYRILQVEMARAGVAEPGPQTSALMRLDQPELDWVALAKGCGVPGTRVETADELDRLLPRALAEPGPQLIEMMI